MCTYCRSCRRRTEKIESLIHDLKYEKEDICREIAYEAGHMSWSCCLGSKGVLIDAILEAIKFLGLEDDNESCNS